VVVNLAWLGERVRRRLGDGRRWGVRIVYSEEPEGALETGGGLCKALPLLGPEPFWAVNADVFTDYPLQRLVRRPAGLAHLVLVDNPAHRPEGDFRLDQGRVRDTGPGERLTFAGLGCYHPELFRDCGSGAFPLAPLLREAMARDQVSGEYYPGRWCDVGTPERLRQLHRDLRRGA